MVAKGFYDPDSPDVVFHFDDEAGQFVNNLYNEMAAKFNKKWHPEAADSTLNPEEMGKHLSKFIIWKHIFAQRQES